MRSLRAPKRLRIVGGCTNSARVPDVTAKPSAGSMARARAASVSLRGMLPTSTPIVSAVTGKVTGKNSSSRALSPSSRRLPGLPSASTRAITWRAGSASSPASGSAPEMKRPR